jgi:hypothetical protein
MPVSVATLPMRMKSGTTTRSMLADSENASEASWLIAAEELFRIMLPMKPTANMAKATGMRSPKRTKRARSPMTPIISLLMSAPWSPVHCRRW